MDQDVWDLGLQLFCKVVYRDIQSKNGVCFSWLNPPSALYSLLVLLKVKPEVQEPRRQGHPGLTGNVAILIHI